MSHATQAPQDVYAMLAQMRQILTQHDADARDWDDVNVYEGMMWDTLDTLWQVMRAHSPGLPDQHLWSQTRYEVHACLTLLTEVCRQPDWTWHQQPDRLDRFHLTLKTLRWLLRVNHARQCPVSENLGNPCTCFAGHGR